MLIYLIIAAELAILYTVFWYVYVRDPKPYKITGNPWGKYGETGFTAGGIDPTLPFVIAGQPGNAVWQTVGKQAAASPLERLTTLPTSRLMQRRYSLGHRHQLSAAIEQTVEQPLFNRVLDAVGRTLEGFSVRLP